MNAIEYFVGHSTDFISSGGVFVGFFLVFLECFVPALPLCAFVALNVNAFGFLLGVFISWIATCLGSYICYRFFSFVEKKVTQKYMNKKTVQKIKKGIDKFKKIRFTELVLIITLPFTPSFLVNILCGLTRMSQEKFCCALLIGKCFSIIFWGYIGKSLLESLTDMKSIIYILVTLGLAFILSKMINRKMNLE
ncbi:MAG: TVP38/TMEM64 family protein [Bacilli bacterium]|nr:TVP38/TMEM64 family protein [Bacilli bacterium]